jgi:hypothetical protein
MTPIQISALKKLSVRVDALRRAMDAVASGSTPEHGKWGAFKSFARAYDRFAREYVKLSGDSEINLYTVERLQNATATIWPVQKQIFDTIYADVLILSGVLSEYDVGVSASISEIQDLLTANLRKVIYDEPKKEIEIQNAIEALLIGRGYQKSIHYDRESGRIKFSGKEFIPDFTFPYLHTALEVKLVTERQQVSKCVEEMSADVPAYLSVYSKVLFCVYDVGAIRDVQEFQGGFERQDGVRIAVIKH